MEASTAKNETGLPLERPADDKAAVLETVKDEPEATKEQVAGGENDANQDTLSVEDLKVLRQLEFYFSDSNFRRDKFLRGKADEDEAGFVDLSVLLTFNRMKQLCTDAEKLAKIASTSTRLVMSEDKLRVRRKTKLPEKDNSRFRTIYASNIPSGETLESLLALFSNKDSFTVLSVRMRRNRETREFNGTAFVEYENEEDCKKAVEETEFKLSSGEVISTKLLTTYLKEIRDTTPTRNANGSGDHGSNTRKRKEKDGKPKVNLKIESGSCLYLEGLAPENVDREGMKELFSKFGAVAYVDFQRGDVSGRVRMSAADEVTKIMEAYAAKKDDFQLGGQTFEMRKLVGDEEASYMAKVESMRRERRERSNKKHRN